MSRPGPSKPNRNDPRTWFEHGTPVWFIDVVRFTACGVFLLLFSLTVATAFRGPPSESQLRFIEGSVDRVEFKHGRESRTRVLSLRGSGESFTIDRFHPGIWAVSHLRSGERIELGVDARWGLLLPPTHVYAMRRGNEPAFEYADVATWAERGFGGGAWCPATAFLLLALVSLSFSGLKSGSRLEQWYGRI
ncbi:MAG: hypothetical protein AAGF84_04260 [Planctomycetota bacterium]